jgi:hypothetical protein
MRSIQVFLSTFLLSLLFFTSTFASADDKERSISFSLNGESQEIYAPCDHVGFFEKSFSKNGIDYILFVEDLSKLRSEVRLTVASNKEGNIFSGQLFFCTRTDEKHSNLYVRWSGKVSNIGAFSSCRTKIRKNDSS